jgi:dephospho-CoA kinase
LIATHLFFERRLLLTTKFNTTLTMGKQSKRKNKSKNKQAASAEGGSDAKALTLLQRLRHSDPRTRHAALAALSTTVLDAESLTKAAQSNKKVPVDLLQAIRERVMDKDLECAQAAAGCLANYIS